MINRTQLQMRLQIFKQEQDVKIYEKNSPKTLIYRKQVKGQQWAIKKLKQTEQTKLQYELCQQFTKIKSKYLVQIKQAWKNQQYYFIAMKYYNKQNLQTYIKNNWKQIQTNPGIGIKIFMKILYGLVELKYSHRDIKPTNILISQQNDGEIKVVISDFGSCNRGQSVNKSKVGTYMYMAPQIKYLCQQSIPYSYNVDIWSVGFVVWQIFCGIDENNFRDVAQRQFIKLPYNYDIFEKQCKRCENNIERKKEFQKYVEQNKLYFIASTPLAIKYILRYMIYANPSKRLNKEDILLFFYENFDLLFEYFPHQNKKNILQELVHYKNLATKKGQMINNNIAKIQKLKSLYENFYLILKDLNVTQRQYYKMSYFMYFVLAKIKNIHESLKKQKSINQQLLIVYVFKTNKNFKQVLLAFSKVRQSLNLIFSDSQMKKFYEQNSKNILIKNQDIRKILTDFVKDQQKVGKIYDQFKSIYD